MDWRVIAMSAATGLLSTLLFSIAPAVRATNVDLASGLRASSRAIAGGHGAARAALVLIQIASSFVLVVAGSLLIKSVRSVRDADPGFQQSRVFATAVNLTADGYDSTRAAAFVDALSRRLIEITGVEGVAIARSMPFSQRPYETAPISVDGYVSAANEQPVVDYNIVSPDYFATMGIPLARGRTFTASDDDRSAPVAIVSQTMASTFWPNANPVGKTIRSKGRAATVVGVAADIKYRSLTSARHPLYYVPIKQNPIRAFGIYVRSASSAVSLVPSLRRGVQSLDANLLVSEIIPLSEQIARSTSAQQIAVSVVAIFGGVSLFLAAVGLYGVTAYAVLLRRREIAIRMALGSSPERVVAGVVQNGLLLTAAGWPPVR